MSVIQGTANQASTRGFYDFPLEQSLRLNDNDSAYLTWTPDSAGNRKTFTISVWVKRGNIGASSFYPYILDGGTSNEHKLAFVNDTLSFGAWAGSDEFNLTTTQLFRDTSAWYHIVVAQDTTQATASDRVKMYVNGEQVTSFSTSSYPSLNYEGRINNTNEHAIGRWQGGTSRYFDGYMAEVNFIDGTALDASSFGELKNGVWIPKDPSELTYGTNGFRLSFADDAEVEAFNTVLYRGTSATQSITGVGFQPDLVWIKSRTGTQWHSLFDPIRGAGNRLFSNDTSAESYNAGSLQSWDTDGFTVGNNTTVNQTGLDLVAWCWDAGANNTPTGHSSVTYTSTSANQSITGVGFEPDLVWIKDRTSGNSHHLFDQVRGAGKRLMSNETAAESTVTSHTSFDADGFTLGSQGQGITVNNNNYVAWGWKAGDSNVSNTDGSITSTVRANDTTGFSIVSWTGTGSLATVGHGLSSAPSWIIIKNRTDDEVWRVYHTGTGATVGLKLNDTSNDVDNTNTGIFNDTAPTSSVFTVNTFNSANGSGDSMIAYCFHDVTGKQKFDTYSGTGSDVTVNTGFRPGWLMIKRTDSGDQWLIKDSSRSPFNPLSGDNLYADASTAEGGGSSTAVEFTSTGFKVTGTDSMVNANGGTYIYAAFAGSYSDYITDYNEDGSIDSRVKANDTTGFSIVSYTGDSGTGSTVGHGLSSAPEFYMIKNRDSGFSWTGYHEALGSGFYIQLDSTGAATSTSDWNNTAPTSSVFTVSGAEGRINFSGTDYIAYCWAEKAGYSSFGSYTGNGSSTGPTVTTGFKPAWLMVKRSDGGSETWPIHDNTRSVVNPTEAEVWANLSNAEQTSGTPVDLLSNGFQVKNTTGQWNTSGATYIYAAFADTREAAFWLDQSGNDNDWQPVNLDHNDTVADSPTDNFCTWNPLVPSTGTFADGNLSNTTTVDKATSGTILVSSGKHYCEIICTSATTIANARLGVVNDSGIGTALGGNANTWAYLADGRVYHNGSASSYGTTLAVNDVFQIALDIDAGKVWYGINGTWMASGDPTAGTNPSQTFTANQSMTFAVASGSGTFTFVANFGQQPFKYDPPE